MVVLKGIPSVLSPELLYALAKMGHGDELGMFFLSNCITKIIVGHANSHLKYLKSEHEANPCQHTSDSRTALHFYSPVAANVLFYFLQSLLCFFFDSSC